MNVRLIIYWNAKNQYHSLGNFITKISCEFKNLWLHFCYTMVTKVTSRFSVKVIYSLWWSFIKTHGIFTKSFLHIFVGIYSGRCLKKCKSALHDDIITMIRQCQPRNKSFASSLSYLILEVARVKKGMFWKGQ